MRYLTLAAAAVVTISAALLAACASVAAVEQFELNEQLRAELKRRPRVVVTGHGDNRPVGAPSRPTTQNDGYHG